MNLPRRAPPNQGNTEHASTDHFAPFFWLPKTRAPCAGSHGEDALRRRGGRRRALLVQGEPGKPRGGVSVPVQDDPQQVSTGAAASTIVEEGQECHPYYGWRWVACCL